MPRSSSDAQSDPSVQTPRKPSPSGATPTLFTPDGVGPGGGELIGVSAARVVPTNSATATREPLITRGITDLVAPPSSAAVWAAPAAHPPGAGTAPIRPAGRRRDAARRV